MRNLLSTLALTAPLALMAQPASAQLLYWPGYSTYSTPSFQTINTPYGQVRSNSTQIGNTTYTNIYGPDGDSIMCNTTVIGSNVFSNCF